SGSLLRPAVRATSPRPGRSRGRLSKAFARTSATRIQSPTIRRPIQMRASGKSRSILCPMSPKNIEYAAGPATTRRAAFSSSRRAFVTAATAASYRRILGANDRVQVGFIGYGLIGAQHVFDFKNQTDVDMAAISEVYQPRMEQAAAAMGGSPRQYKD